MKFCFLLFLLFAGISFSLHAQTSPPKDTVAAGQYYPLDSNVVSCTVSIIRNGSTVMEITVRSNKLPASVIHAIQSSPVGTTVIYDQLIVNDNGARRKRPAIIYVVGKRNTRAGAIHSTGLKG